MTNIKFLLIGTSLSLIPNLTFAQCVASQDCETLGYTETSCNGSKGIKCPFGNKWACFSNAEACKQEGFVFDCNNTGETGEISCGGKYKKCICDKDYYWTGEKCELCYGYSECENGCRGSDTCSKNGKTLCRTCLQKTCSHYCYCSIIGFTGHVEYYVVCNSSLPGGSSFKSSKSYRDKSDCEAVRLYTQERYCTWR